MKRLLPPISGYAPIQRFEKPTPAVYYAPEWKLHKSGKHIRDVENYSPMFNYGMNPEKWRYLNKVVWPPNYIVPETGKPKSKEVFFCKESIHLHPKKIFNACTFAKNMITEEAIKQLRHMQTKPTVILAEVIEEAADLAKDEYRIERPLEKMFVAEAFAIQCKIIKGARLHAIYRKNGTIHYRYINLFVRLEEGEPPKFKGREPVPNGWDKMQDYYAYLRSRDVKYSL